MFTKTWATQGNLPCIMLPVIVLLINAPAHSQTVQPDENPMPKTETTLPGTPEPPVPVGELSPKSIAPKVEPLVKPVEKLPAGYDAAVKAFNEKKYPYATMQFEKFIKAGANDERIHDYLAQCYYRQRVYSKAIREYDWLAKNAKHSVSLQNSSAKTARILKCYMAGECPGTCLKPNDPRWREYPGLAGKWMKFDLDTRIFQNNAHFISYVHVGHTLTLYKGDPRIGELCPYCRGAGRIRPVKDGDPL